MADWGLIPSRPLTAHFYVNPTMTNIWPLLFGGFWFGGFQFGGFWIDGFRFDVVWVSYCYGWLLRIQCWLVRWCGASKLPVASDFAAASFWVSCSGFGEAGFEALGSAASVWQLPDSGGIRYTIGCLNPQVSPRLQNPALPNPMWEKPWVHLVPFPTDATINLFY